jgi:hypothetical protein
MLSSRNSCPPLSYQLSQNKMLRKLSMTNNKKATLGSQLDAAGVSAKSV